MYRLDVRTTEKGYAVKIRCLYGRIGGDVELDAADRARPDAEALAVSLLADQHDRVCAHHCLAGLRRKVGEPPDRPTPRVPDVTAILGQAQVSIADAPELGPREYKIVLGCRHRESVAYCTRESDDKEILEEYAEAMREVARRHRAITHCSCVPAPLTRR